MKELRIVIGIPTFGYIQPEFFDSWNAAYLFMLNNMNVTDVDRTIVKFDNMEKKIEEITETIKMKEGQGTKIRMSIFTVPRTQNHHARNLIMERAVEFNADYLIMVDDDMVLQKNSFLHLIDRMEQVEKFDVLALLAFKRGEPFTPVGYRWEGDMMEIVDITQNGIIECDAVGFGCVIIRGSLLEKMNPPYCLVDDFYRGSDIYFCHKAKSEFDAKIYIDTTHEIGHLGFGKPVYKEDYLKYHGIK